MNDSSFVDLQYVVVLSISQQNNCGCHYSIVLKKLRVRIQLKAYSLF